ncbi:MAG TPA: peptide ABC transporter substrate-binding protein [Verrucomicrobiae bacterium]|nr:peptide ABC transporter substrate-binding protein [Verrucomicrobiae bacterium]
MRLKAIPAGAFLLVLLLLAGCGGSERKTDLVIINGPDPETLDPALATGIEDLRVVAALFEGLTRTDPVTARPIPGLASRWEISPDGCVYTFHLRDNLMWSPGEPITAGDVVYSWLRVLNPLTAAEYAGQLFYVKNGEAYLNGKIKDPSEVGVHALDSRTVRVELNHPTPFFLDLCSFQTLAVAPRKLIEKYGEDWMRVRPLPTSGPYMLDQWRLNDKIRLVKNPYYWDAANTRSEVVDLLPISAPSTALDLYQAGGADIIWDRDNVPYELTDLLSKRPDFHTFEYLGTYFIRCNTTRRPFNDARVRKAFALTIDKRRLTERILRDGEQPADHLVPNGTANYDPATGLGYDPAEGRRLLAEAGYPGGKSFPPVSYLFDSASGGRNIHLKMAVEMQQMWEEQLGVHVELKQMEKRVYLAAQSSLDYDLTRSTWIGDYDDPNTFLDLFRSDNGNNRTGWKNAKYDELMESANQEVDLRKRAALLKEAETILVRDEATVIPIYFYSGFNYYDPAKIKGIYPNILDEHPLNDIWKVPGASLQTAQTR